MKNIFNDSNKIRLYAQIQEDLNNLPENASDDELESLINSIPTQILTQKDDLMIICKLFAFYARNFQQTSKKNALNLFDKILDLIKKYIQNESEFFFNIFGGIHYLHLYMYHHGLISIEEIIQRTIKNKFPPFVEYFLPEIIEREPELFEKEIKSNLNFEYNKENIEKFKELRSKHFKWLRESNDYNDPIYREIEKNSLRFSIKTDDIESFQKIFSNLNLNVNSTISESLIENVFVSYPEDSTLLEFAIQFNSMKIVKFLIMNGSDAKSSIYHSIWRRNYEIIHMIESLEKEEFEKYSLYYSITVCNNEMTEYSLNNFDNCYPLSKSEFDANDVDDLLSIIGNTFRSSNFIFLEQILIPFLRKNEKFVKDHIYEILIKATEDHSGYFLREFLKFPNININYNSSSLNEMSLLDVVLNKRISKCAEIILNRSDLILDYKKLRGINPVILACLFMCDIKTLDLICNHKNADISDVNMLVSSSALIGNTYAINYFFNRFDNELIDISNQLLSLVLLRNKLFTLKLLLKRYISKNEELSSNDIIEEFKNFVKNNHAFNEDVLSKFCEVVHEIKPN